MLDEVSSLSGLEVSKLRLKHVEETQSKRIDTQLYLKETMTLPDELRVLNTLHDVRLSHNCALMIEEKSAEEIAGESEGTGGAATTEIEHLDDSENARTVIANVSGFDEFQRYQVNIDWTITELRDFLVV